MKEDCEALKNLGWHTGRWPDMMMCGTGSFGAILQNMVLNAGRAICIYDELDTFVRVHGIVPAGSDDMSLTLTAYDGGDICRGFMGAKWNVDVNNPHFNIFVCAQPHVYLQRLFPLIPCGGGARLVHNPAEKIGSFLDRLNFKKKSTDVIDHLAVEVLLNTALENISECGLYAAQVGKETVIQYTTLVDALLATFDHIVQLYGSVFVHVAFFFFLLVEFFS